MKKLKKPKSPSAKSLKPLKKSSEPSAPASLLQASSTESTLRDATPEFEKVIEESKKTLAETTAAKRGRGRPRKIISGTPGVDENLASGDRLNIGNEAVQSPSGYPLGTTVALWKIGSKFAAARTGFDQFECDAADCEALDEATVPVLSRYFPPALAESSPLITFAITAVAIFGMKTIAYYDWKRAQEKEVQTKTQPGEPKPIALEKAVQPLFS